HGRIRSSLEGLRRDRDKGDVVLLSLRHDVGELRVPVAALRVSPDLESRPRELDLASVIRKLLAPTLGFRARKVGYTEAGREVLGREESHSAADEQERAAGGNGRKRGEHQQDRAEEIVPLEKDFLL